MPYIRESLRKELDKEIDQLTDKILHRDNKEISLCGILNYVFTRLCHKVIKDNFCYFTINNVIGALECCKLELYRRIASPYEDEKIKENGDV